MAKNFAFIFSIVVVNDSDRSPQSPSAKNDHDGVEGTRVTTVVVEGVVDGAEDELIPDPVVDEECSVSVPDVEGAARNTSASRTETAQVAGQTSFVAVL